MGGQSVYQVLTCPHLGDNESGSWSDCQFASSPVNQSVI